LIDKTSSIYLYVKLKALASWIFLSFTSFWRNSNSYEHKNKSARRGAHFVHFPNMCSNIPASPAYGVYISQLIRSARASSNYSDFLKRHLHLRNRLLDQGYKSIARCKHHMQEKLVYCCTCLENLWF
jgi:hypothetical protein